MILIVVYNGYNFFRNILFRKTAWSLYGALRKRKTNKAFENNGLYMFLHTPLLLYKCTGDPCANSARSYFNPTLFWHIFQGFEETKIKQTKLIQLCLTA